MFNAMRDGFNMNIMDVLSAPTGYLLPFIVAITVIVFIHELGHYLVARWCGVNIEIFSIGFGREIFGWYDSQGTRWKVCWIPLGGYVKFKGDANAASLPQATSEPIVEGNFHGKPVWQRAAVVAAGPMANFILAIALFTGLFAFAGIPTTEPRAQSVVAGSAAEKVGIAPGDLIKAVDGRPVETFNDLVRAVQFRGGETLDLQIDRGGTPITLKIVPEIKVESDGFGGTVRIGRLGIKIENKDGVAPMRKLPFTEAVAKGTEQTWQIVSLTFVSLGKIFKGEESAKQIGGMISMGKAAGDAASRGVYGFMGLIAFFSVSIGIINLFPIPMLDGGHLVYYAIEAVRGKPVGQQAQEWGFRVGLSLVVMLMAFGFGNDLTRVFTMITGG